MSNKITEYVKYTDDELLKLVFIGLGDGSIPSSADLTLELAQRLQRVIEERDMVEAEI